MACGALGFSDAGLVFLGAGVFSWLSLEPAILQRLRSAGELPTPLRTSLGIQLAPALVACSAWLSVNGGRPIPSLSCCLVTACCSCCLCSV